MKRMFVNKSNNLPSIFRCTLDQPGHPLIRLEKRVLSFSRPPCNRAWNNKTHCGSLFSAFCKPQQSAFVYFLSTSHFSLFWKTTKFIFMLSSPGLFTLTFIHCSIINNFCYWNLNKLRREKSSRPFQFANWNTTDWPTGIVTNLLWGSDFKLFTLRFFEVLW